MAALSADDDPCGRLIVQTHSALLEELEIPVAVGGHGDGSLPLFLKGSGQ